MIIAIDGPAGSGKSTISKLLAKKLGFIYLDTGAMYRALTLKVIKLGLDSSQTEAIIDLAAKFDFKFGQNNRVFLDGVDVTEDIRTPQVEKIISGVCSIAQVRAHFVSRQRALASKSSCVTEGRDTTTVVFPDAELKIFLDASVKVRAARRLKDFQAKNISADLSAVQNDLTLRDQSDYNRAVGALKQSPDAIVIDTSGLTIEEVVEKIYTLAKEKNQTGSKD